MSGLEQDVKKSVSSADDQDQIPPPSGKKEVSAGRGVEEVMAENKRKADEIASLKSDKGALESRLEELEEKDRLTAKERAEKAALETGIDSIESQVKLLRSNPDANQKVWLKTIREDAENAALEATFNAEKRRSNEVLYELVDDHGDKLKVKTIKELAALIKPYGLKYNEDVNSGEMTLVTRTRKAFRDFMKSQSQSEEIAKREETLRKKEAALAGLEGGGRARRIDSVDDFKTLSGSKKISAVVDALGSTKTR